MIIKNVSKGPRVVHELKGRGGEGSTYRPVALAPGETRTLNIDEGTKKLLDRMGGFEFGASARVEKRAERSSASEEDKGGGEEDRKTRAHRLIAGEENMDDATFMQDAREVLGDDWTWRSVPRKATVLSALKKV